VVKSALMKVMLRSLGGFLTRPLLNRIKKLEANHEGEDCYIFGDGSSVSFFDLSRFNDKVGIAVNAFPRHIDAPRVSIKYWIVAEAGFFLPPIFKRRNMNEVSGFRNRVRFQSFYRRRQSERDFIMFTSVSNFLTTLHPKMYYFWGRLPKVKKRFGYVSNHESFAGSICAALTLAEYLGFKRAYLVGIDNTHNPGTSHHWYESVRPIKSAQIPGAYHSEFFSEIQKYIEIITVTPFPQETELPSIDYETLTTVKPQFRRNIDLLSPRDLRLLALNPHYQILAENTTFGAHQ
jgi:hypothetical protein